MQKTPLAREIATGMPLLPNLLAPPFARRQFRAASFGLKH